MLSSKLPGIAAFAGTIAVGVWVWVPAASSGSPSSVDDKAKYAPVQSISYEFGSKAMSGYFVEQSATCVVTLMITEKSDPEGSLAQTPTRVRLELTPGQIVGLDSEEGRSLNFTCGEGATTLSVDVGEREKLVQLQNLALQDYIAQKDRPNLP
jgi:hypothetical protein